MSKEYAGRQVVGMDLHRQGSVLVRMTGAPLRYSQGSPRAQASPSKSGSQPAAAGHRTGGLQKAGHRCVPPQPVIPTRLRSMRPNGGRAPLVAISGAQVSYWD